MKHRLGAWILFLVSLAGLVISLGLFWNLGLYTDEYNTSPSIVCGGTVWLYLDWLRLGLLAVLVLATGSKLLARSGAGEQNG